MANSIAFAKNHTVIIDEVYKRASVSNCLASGARMMRRSAAHVIRTRTTSLESSALFARPHGRAENSFGNDEALTATYDNGIELIKDRVSQLGWEDMERLVAGMLKAMGYCARVTPKGPDGGRDVIASPDALGLESPRIVAEVKHRKGAMGAPAVRSFIGGLRAGDRGLYVSTGGFTKEARYEADRANVPVRLLDLDTFVRHYVEVYDKTDDETRSILPLTRIWWPA